MWGLAKNSEDPYFMDWNLISNFLRTPPGGAKFPSTMKRHYQKYTLEDQSDLE